MRTKYASYPQSELIRLGQFPELLSEADLRELLAELIQRLEK